MKQLTCEMCGSTNMLKQDGMFVCQDCGTKYSVEEAKKLMIELSGKVDVSGSTVKIDNKEKIENLRALATRAREADDSPTAARYYGELALLAPDDWEAHFYTVFYECKNIKIAQIGSAARRVGSLIDSTFKLISETADNYAKKITAEATVSMDVVKFSGFLRENAQNFIMKNYTELSAVNEKVNEWVVPIYEMVLLLGDADIKYFKNYDFAIQHYGLINSAGYILKQTAKGRNLISIANSRITNAKNLQTKANNEKKERQYKEAKDECKNESVDELIENAFDDLKSGDVAAIARFDRVIEKLPDDCIGYLGKAVAVTYCGSGKYSEMFAPILAIKKKSIEGKYKDKSKELLNYYSGKEGCTLLMHACGAKNLEVAKILIELGADVNVRQNNKATALWLLGFKALPQDKLTEGREIARLLIERGASVEITNVGGVALYNKNTDPVIAKMIREKKPGIKKGVCVGGQKSGCYVATCVYGSYDCPEVWTLRRYRDYQLAKTRRGRAFIHTYYAIAPTMVRLFGKRKWFNKFWKSRLDKKVKKLNGRGFENTPYQDLNW